MYLNVMVGMKTTPQHWPGGRVTTVEHSAEGRGFSCVCKRQSRMLTYSVNFRMMQSKKRWKKKGKSVLLFDFHAALGFKRTHHCSTERETQYFIREKLRI